MYKIFIIAIFLFLPLFSFSQDLIKEKKDQIFEDGITARMENDFFMRARFRMQNRYTYTSEDSDFFNGDRSEFLIRRTRLRFDGHMFQEKILFRLQLSFTRWDQDWDNSGIPNVLRDAVFGYSWMKNHTLWFGMTKLPGNRQRVISSGAQQFVDRSQLNALFNIDRDMGLQHFSKFNDEKPLWIKLAVSNGQGRNQQNQDTSMATTARVEWYPLGGFNDDGDNFEADLFREATPKIGLGATVSHNPDTNRTSGQLGTTLPSGETVNLTTTLVDVFYKYRGHSISAEYAHRNASRSVITNGSDLLFVTKGSAYNFQTGYIFENNIEPALRFTKIDPDEDIRQYLPRENIYTAGITKYVNNHVFKIQTDLSYHDRENYLGRNFQSAWELRFQVEFGI